MEEDPDTLAELRRQKQLYLKANIVDLGYDKHDFAHFMSQYKDSNGNIDLWSYDELKDIVAEFQEQNQPLGSPERHSANSDELNRSEDSPNLPRVGDDSPTSKSYNIKENNDIHNIEHEQDFIDDFEKI